MDLKLREECFRGAKYVGRLLEGLGAEVKMVRQHEDRNPLVLARLGQHKDRPTVTFYAHYDVQPANEMDWRTKPFEMAAIDGYFYGRGVSDNKVGGLIKCSCTLCWCSSAVCSCLEELLLRLQWWGASDCVRLCGGCGVSVRLTMHSGCGCFIRS
jgi:Peptidase family M20/M25/M40